MKKYKDTYKVVQQKDIFGKPSINRDDVYIPCQRGGQIYRFGAFTLMVYIVGITRCRRCLDRFKAAGVPILSGCESDDDGTYMFHERYLDDVAEIVGARKRRVLTEEQREKLANQLAKNLSR